MSKATIDKSLMDVYRSNPDEGFKQIVVTYQERIYWHIRRYTKNHDDTEDVMQNVFIKVWAGLKNFREDSSLYTWLFRIAYNETHTFLKSASKRVNFEQDPPLFEKGIVVEGKEYSGDEIEKILKDALDTLPEKQRLVFELRYFEEIKFTEISDMTGTSVGALKASYHLAAKKIEEIIKQY